jgi:predicted oxidoreductase
MRIAAIITHKQAFAAISMGFKGFHLFLVVFAWVFKWYPLKPMQIIGSPYSHLLKPMRIATNKQLKDKQSMKIA